MELLPIDVSKQLYERYAATLMDPEPLTDEMRDCSSNFRATYEKGIVVTREQLLWIWDAHNKSADLSEPYDVGVFNALELALYVCCDQDPVFKEKPKGHRSQIEILVKEVEGLRARIIADQKSYSDKLGAMGKVAAENDDLASKVVELTKEIGDLKSQQKAVAGDEA